LLTTRSHGLEGDVALADKNKALLAKRLKVYDQILAKQKYIAGDNLTLVDLFHLTYGNLNVTVSGLWTQQCTGAPVSYARGRC
jgi:glutathione S-transferase